MKIDLFENFIVASRIRLLLTWWFTSLVKMRFRQVFQLVRTVCANAWVSVSLLPALCNTYKYWISYDGIHYFAYILAYIYKHILICDTRNHFNTQRLSLESREYVKPTYTGVYVVSYKVLYTYEIGSLMKLHLYLAMCKGRDSFLLTMEPAQKLVECYKGQFRCDNTGNKGDECFSRRYSLGRKKMYAWSDISQMYATQVDSIIQMYVQHVIFAPGSIHFCKAMLFFN